MLKRQFTLVEVMIALLITCTAMIALYTAMTVSRVTQNGVKRRILANRMITDKLEEMFQIPYKDLVNFRDKYPGGWKFEQITTNHWPVENNENQKNFTIDFTGGNGYMYTMVAPTPEFCSISVYVIWRERDPTYAHGYRYISDWANIYKYNNE